MNSTRQQTKKEIAVKNGDIQSVLWDKNLDPSLNGVISEKGVHHLPKINPQVKLNVKEYSQITKLKPAFASTHNQVVICQNDVIEFLKSLPDASVDIVITDPAYSGMNQRLKLGKGKIIGEYKNAGQDGAKWFGEFHDTEENYTTFLKECYRVLKNNRHIYIMFDSYSLLTLGSRVRNVFDVKNILCWDKANIGMGHYFRRRHEFILFASKGKRHLSSKNIPDVWKVKRVVRMEYPTQKPTEIFEMMLKGSAEKDFVVCDPFAGSGSSAIAAIKANCQFIGCDVADKAVSVIKSRVEHFLNMKVDPYQKNSLLSNDEALHKFFLNGKPQ